MLEALLDCVAAGVPAGETVAAGVPFGEMVAGALRDDVAVDVGEPNAVDAGVPLTVAALVADSEPVGEAERDGDPVEPAVDAGEPERVAAGDPDCDAVGERVIEPVLLGVPAGEPVSAAVLDGLTLGSAPGVVLPVDVTEGDAATMRTSAGASATPRKAPPAGALATSAAEKDGDVTARNSAAWVHAYSTNAPPAESSVRPATLRTGAASTKNAPDCAHAPAVRVKRTTLRVPGVASSATHNVAPSGWNVNPHGLSVSSVAGRPGSTAAGVVGAVA